MLVLYRTATEDAPLAAVTNRPAVLLKAGQGRLICTPRLSMSEPISRAYWCWMERLNTEYHPGPFEASLVLLPERRCRQMPSMRRAASSNTSPRLGAYIALSYFPVPPRMFATSVTFLLLWLGLFQVAHSPPRYSTLVFL